MDSIFIIAEAGVNHNGSVAMARRLIDIAVEAKADAIKFQTWVTEEQVTRAAKLADYQFCNLGEHISQFEMLKKLELSHDEFINLKNYSDRKGIIFLSTADDIPSANFLNNLQNIFKIGSSDITNIPHLRNIGSFKKNVILSTGMSNMQEIEAAIAVLVEAGTLKECISLLHATSSYPCPVDEVNLLAIKTIKDQFGTKVGYSDHTSGIHMSLAAVAFGAQIIEKHFTESRLSIGPDHKASIEPRELFEMISLIRDLERAFGDGKKIPSKSEVIQMPLIRKSIVARRLISKGETFSEENIAIKRPGNGLSPLLWDDIINSSASRDYVADEPIQL